MKFICSQRSALLFVAILAIAVIFNSCRKDLLVQSPDNLKSSLSIAEAKSYFNSQIAPNKGKNAKTVFSSEPKLAEIVSNKQPLWDQAYYKMISTGQAVKIPIDFGDKVYALIDKEENEVVPLGSLNYLYMYKDSLQNVHAEWVVLQPDTAWLYGERNTYSGRILVRDWNGKTIKNLYYSRINQNSVTFGSKIATSGISKKVQSDENEIDNALGYCIIAADGRCRKKPPCTATSCDLCLAHCARYYCTFYECGPECELLDNGGGGYTPYPSGAGGGRPSSPGKGDYPPNECDGDGLGALKERSMDEKTMAVRPPCVPKPFVLESIANNIVWTVEETQFLANHPDIATAINKYLSDNQNSEEAKDFAKWAVGYLKENPNEDVFALVSAGTSVYYTDEEMEAVINSMTDPITGNGIDLYLILKYKGSKIFELSRYSKSINSIDVGDYTLTPHYDKTGKLVFYAGSRLNPSTARNGIEYIIKPNQLNNFKNNVDYYTSAASLVYMYGVPDKGMIQMMAGDRIDGLLNLWGEALKSPEYWMYLINCFLIEPAHPKVRSAIDDAIPTGAPYTKSTLELGRKMHVEYKLGLADRINTFKEYRLPSGKRIDFIDIENGIVYELKPNNPRQITAGNNQLDVYVSELIDPKTIAKRPELSGKVWRKVLDLY